MKKTEKGVCSECHIEKYLVNLTKRLCDNCNYKRLHGGKSRFEIKKLKPTPVCNFSSKGEASMFMRVWAEREHKCTYCGKMLHGDPKPIYFSHIKSKGAFPELRHCPSNIEIVCAECHQIYEFGDRTRLIK